MGQIMKQTQTHLIAASHIKAELEKIGQASRVTSEKFWMGDIVTIFLEDVDPDRLEQIKKIAKRFQYGTYYRDQDCYRMDNIINDLPQVKYVHISNRPSPRMRLKISRELIANNYPGLELMTNFDVSELILACFQNPEFWEKHLAK